VYSDLRDVMAASILQLPTDEAHQRPLPRGILRIQTAIAAAEMQTNL
jgi:hypothetical protein